LQAQLQCSGSWFTYYYCLLIGGIIRVVWFQGCSTQRGRLTRCALLDTGTILIATIVLIVGHALVLLAALLGIKVLLRETNL